MLSLAEIIHMVMSSYKVLCAQIIFNLKWALLFLNPSHSNHISFLEYALSHILLHLVWFSLLRQSVYKIEYLDQML